MNKYLAELAKLNLIDWPTLVTGINNSWIDKDAISSYAFELLHSGETDEDIALLAGSDSLSEDEVSELLAKLCKKNSISAQATKPLSLEKWRLAILSELQNSSLTPDEKLERLQELYADFGYPEDMASCSIYAQDGTDPMAALQKTINSLEERLTSNNK